MMAPHVGALPAVEQYGSLGRFKFRGKGICPGRNGDGQREIGQQTQIGCRRQGADVKGFELAPGGRRERRMRRFQPVDKKWHMRVG